MPPKRRGSQTAATSATWTELFQRIAPAVLQGAVQGSLYPETVLREIPAIAKTAVQYVQKSASSTTTNEKNAAASQREPNKNDNKVDNATDNKKSNVPAKAKTAVKNVQKSTSTTTTNAKDAAGSQKKPKKTANKLDNVTDNQKGDVPVIAKTAVQNVQKSTSTTTTNAKDGAVSQKKTNKTANKVDNVTDNKKGDVSAIAKTAVQNVQKSTSTITTNAKDGAVSQKKPNKTPNKVDNVTDNKKGDVSATAKTAVQNVQKSASTTTTNAKDAAVAQGNPNKTDNKVDNVTDNKKGDVSALRTNSDNYDCGYAIECARCCKEDADDLDDTDLLGSSFVHVELEDNVKCNISQSISAIIKGLPNHVTEDQVLKELAEEHFYPITVVRKTTCKEYCEYNDSLFLVKVPKFIESRLLILGKLLGYRVDVQKQDTEPIMAEFTECKTIDHGKTHFSGSNSIADLGYNSVISNNSHSSNESIHKPDFFSSSRNSIPNSQNVKEECESYESISKETYIGDTTKLLHELRDVKKELEQIKFELKINVAKKNSHFLRVILQGIPPEIKNEDIVNDLKSKQFSVNIVYRLGNENNEATDQVVFELPKAEDHIFYFSCCLGFQVQVEEYTDDFSYVKYKQAALNTFNMDISPKKPINLLFRGIPTDISENDILRDLKEKGFHPIAIHGMVLTKRDLLGKSNHVVLVQVPLEQEHIYELSCILGYPVTVEGVDKGTLNVAQCKTCMQFGHKANMCSGKTTSKVVPKIPDQKCKITNDVPIFNAVVKGVPIEFDDKIVISDLIKNGFNPIAIHRMVVDGEILPTYLVQVPEREKRVLILTCCLGFNVKVEKFLPHMYHVEQCRKCSQFGHCDEDCPDAEPIDLPDTNGKNMTENIDNKESIIESISNFDNSEKIENIKKESSLSAPTSPSFSFNSTQSNCLELQLLVDKLDNLEVVLKNFITKSNETHCKLCSCSIVSNISTNDTSTNTDNTYAQLGEMKQAIKSYENISIQFLRNMGLFAQAFMGLDNNIEDISNAFEAYRKLKDLSGGTTSFVEAMIRILKSTINIMLDIPNIPGVTINTINEQLHLLEELKNIKINNMARTPAPFTKEYDVDFPKL